MRTAKTFYICMPVREAVLSLSEHWRSCCRVTKPLDGTVTFPNGTSCVSKEHSRTHNAIMICIRRTSHSTHRTQTHTLREEGAPRTVNAPRSTGQTENTHTHTNTHPHQPIRTNVCTRARACVSFALHRVRAFFSVSIFLS